MKLFLSKYVNRVDKKGRVSVPASFRSVLKDQSFTGVVVYQSFINNCIEACSMEKMEKFLLYIEEINPFSGERDALAVSVFGNSLQLHFDGDGRVVLPYELMIKVGIDDKAAFVGKGSTFEIWNPDALESHIEQSLKRASVEATNLKFGGGAR